MTASLEGVWSLKVLRHCTDTHGVMCWGCGRRSTGRDRTDRVD